MRVTLLGTGCPIVDVERYGPATLVEEGGETWLLDCGSGVTQRLLGHGSSGARISGLLLTHLHSDHTVDFPQLLISGWHQGRTAPLKVYGPRGTKDFFGRLLEAWQPEFRQRIAHELRPPDGLQVVIEEIGPGWKLATESVSITLTEVRHQPVPQAFGFRFDAGGAGGAGGADGSSGASVTISGDTAYSPELIGLAKDCDLLVHEAFVHWQYEENRKTASELARRNIASYHTSTAEVGRVATEAGARNLALTHFVPTRFDRPRLVAEVREQYQGGFFVGDDLMSLEVTPGAVSLLRSGGGLLP